MGERLEQLGLQRAIQDGKKKAWELTEACAEHGAMVPYSGRNGHASYQILWKESVLEMLRKPPQQSI